MTNKCIKCSHIVGEETTILEGLSLCAICSFAFKRPLQVGIYKGLTTNRFGNYAHHYKPLAPCRCPDCNALLVDMFFDCSGEGYSIEMSQRSLKKLARVAG